MRQIETLFIGLLFVSVFDLQAFAQIPESDKVGTQRQMSVSERTWFQQRLRSAQKNNEGECFAKKKNSNNIKDDLYISSHLSEVLTAETLLPHGQIHFTDSSSFEVTYVRVNNQNHDVTQVQHFFENREGDLIWKQTRMSINRKPYMRCFLKGTSQSKVDLPKLSQVVVPKQLVKTLEYRGPFFGPSGVQSCEGDCKIKKNQPREPKVSEVQSPD